MNIFSHPRKRLVFIYIVLLLAYAFVFHEHIVRVAHLPELLIVPIMSLGSFVAGSTFLGGGAVAFPALTKILHVDPVTAKTFSLAIQSVGMTSASLYIVYRVRNLPFRFIGYYVLAALPGLLISLLFLENRIASGDIRVGFTLFILCFVLVYMRTHKNTHGRHLEKLSSPFDHNAISLTPIAKVVTGLCAFIGGGISGLLGSGADLMAFCLLALYFRIDIKLATQVSVIIMASTSLLGITVQGLFLHNIPAGVFPLWVLAAPIVLLGAPLGAIFCRRSTSSTLLILIICIVAIEIVTTLLIVPIGREKYVVYGLLFTAGLIFLYLLFRHSPFHMEIKAQNATK